MVVEYSYKARDNSGQTVIGVLRAETERDVIAQLQEKEYTPVKISRVAVIKPKGAKAVRVQTAPYRPVRVTDLLAFCLNISTLVGAGITLMGALNVVSRQLENPYLADVTRQVARMISEGSTFSDALEKFPRAFSKFFVNMMRVGEVSGTMEDVLIKMGVFLEKEDELRQKIRSALAYPMILIVAGIAVILLVVTLVIPQFVMIFEKSGVPLPVPTRILYIIGMWMRQYWWIAILGSWAGIMAVRNLFKVPAVFRFWEIFILRAPLFGSLMCKIFVARFARTLSSLMGAGVPLLQALGILKGAIGNSVFASIIQEVRDSAEKGEGLSGPLRKHSEFPPDVVYMLSVGEESGNIESMMIKAADFYERKVEYSIKGMLVYIEPTFICVLGVCVGGILGSVILPMFDMIKTIQR